MGGIAIHDLDISSLCGCGRRTRVVGVYVLFYMHSVSKLADRVLGIP